MQACWRTDGAVLALGARTGVVYLLVPLAPRVAALPLPSPPSHMHAHALTTRARASHALTTRARMRARPALRLAPSAPCGAQAPPACLQESVPKHGAADSAAAIAGDAANGEADGAPAESSAHGAARPAAAGGGAAVGTLRLLCEPIGAHMHAINR